MLFSTLLTGLGAITAIVSAAPLYRAREVQASQTSKGQNVVYWGQNGGGTVENNDLAAYCTNTAGIDILVLAFLYEFGGSSGTIPSGTIGQSCYISTSGEGQNCDALASAISTCQSAGVKIILSLGGASGSYSLSSDEQASQIGQYLWESYGNSGNTQVQRPFGNVFVNGFDFDIEVNDGSSQYYPAMISTLRSAFQNDPAHQYYITGAPQCPIPEPNMGVIISNATFDYLFVQWYNNNDYAPCPCALPFNGNAPFNYNQWVSFTAGTPSANALIFIGVPAAPDAANGSPSGATYYITPTQLSQLIGEYGTATRFGGIMMWSAGFSDSNVIDGCTYAQQAHSILESGSPCAGAPVTSSSPTTTTTATTTTSTPTWTTTTMMTTISTPTTTPTPTTTTTTPTPTSTGTVGAYDQCGGAGYTGSTQCISGYVCTEISSQWSQCDPA